MTQSLTDLKINERLTRKETDQLMHEYRELELKSEDLIMKYFGLQKKKDYKLRNVEEIDYLHKLIHKESHCTKMIYIFRRDDVRIFQSVSIRNDAYRI